MLLLLAALVTFTPAWPRPDDANSSGQPSSQATINLSLQAKSDTKPQRARLLFEQDLRYCLTAGFPPKTAPKPAGEKPDTYQCPKEQETVSANVDEIINGLSANNSAFAFAKVGAHRLLAFCAAKECPAGDIMKLQSTIKKIARPKPAYFENHTIKLPKPDAGLVGKLAGDVTLISHGSLTARQISEDTIRLLADQLPEPLALSKLIKTIDEDALDPTKLDSLVATADAGNALRVQLPYYCLSGKLDGPAPSRLNAKLVCQNKTDVLLQANNAAMVAGAIKIDKVTVINDSPVSIVASCQSGTCDDDIANAINNSVQALARPIPSYFEDLTIPKGTAATAIAGLDRYKNLGVTADALSDTVIRLKSDAAPLTPSDAATLKQDILRDPFGPSLAPPLQRLFYADAASVVASLAGNRPAPASLAPGVAAPLTGNSATTPSSTTPAAAPGSSANVTNAANGITSGMVTVGDQVVFADPAKTNVPDKQRVRLLTLLDLPRPEVLMSVWSFEESSPDAHEIASRSKDLEDLISAHNDSLQNAIEYGWSYLSRQMQYPNFFDPLFYNYLTRRFVSQDPSCKEGAAGVVCVPDEERAHWGLCEAGQYCLGYAEAFQPLRPTLANILLGIMASDKPFETAFTTIGCMAGKYEVYGNDCFPERPKIMQLLHDSAQKKPEEDAACIDTHRAVYLKKRDSKIPPGCEELDLAALEAQRHCGVPITLPLACFTMQAAKSFVAYHSFSTVPFTDLDKLAEQPIASMQSKIGDSGTYASTPIGLLRASVADFLFNYKMAVEFPSQFSPYELTHAAQQLNAEFNPLVVAFNQDVTAFSRDVMQKSEFTGHGWSFHSDRKFISNGLVTVRGICGVESLVDTDTQSAYSAPQFQTLSSVLASLSNFQNTLSGAPPASDTTTSTSTAQTTNVPGLSASTPDSTTNTTTVSGPTPPAGGFNIQNILRGGLSPASVAAALAAISPTPATAQIGRQFTLDVVPHALPGASSAELEVKLWAQEDSPPALYPQGGNAQTLPLSRVARHNVLTRVRVESVKMFEVSSFSALVQGPGNRYPLIPPFVQFPGISSLLSLPLPGAKAYHRSTAIVSAIMVPTAADLAYGIEFLPDRTIIPEAVTAYGHKFSFRELRYLDQLPDAVNIGAYHKAMIKCLATGLEPEMEACKSLSFAGIAPDR